MPNRMLGRLWSVSALTLGGGGVGQLWGATTREECIATVRTAVERGITLLDMAPAYGNGEAESLVGTAFEGRLPAGVRVTTKHRLGTPPAGEVERNIMRSLEESLARMRLEQVDLFFLHSNIIPDGYDASAYADRPATRWTTYVDRFVPICERLVADGRIGAWGITGIGIPECVLAALNEKACPAAVQCITNPLDLPGELKYFAGPSCAREIIAAGRKRAQACSVSARSRVARSPRRSTVTCLRITPWSGTSSVVELSARWPKSLVRRQLRSLTATRCRWMMSTPSCAAARTGPSCSNALPRPKLVHSNLPS